MQRRAMFSAWRNVKEWLVRHMLQQVAVTPEGVAIVRGLFKLYDTHGLPLAIALDALRAHNMMPDWLDFYDSAVAAGWTPKRGEACLDEAVADVYEPAFVAEWRRRFHECVAAREPHCGNGQAAAGLQS